jgi:hypothetical protein
LREKQATDAPRSKVLDEAALLLDAVESGSVELDDRAVTARAEVQLAVSALAAVGPALRVFDRVDGDEGLDNFSISRLGVGCEELAVLIQLDRGVCREKRRSDVSDPTQRQAAQHAQRTMQARTAGDAVRVAKIWSGKVKAVSQQAVHAFVRYRTDLPGPSSCQRSSTGDHARQHRVRSLTHDPQPDEHRADVLDLRHMEAGGLLAPLVLARELFPCRRLQARRRT